MTQNYLAIAAVHKDENEYLAEWVEYHRLVGVEHFYIYDNESQISARETLHLYIREGIVTVMDWFGQKTGPRQSAIYDQALEQFGPVCNWMAFIDIDEFILPKVNATLPLYLQKMEHVPGIEVNWQIFGSNGHDRKPPGLQIENFTRRALSAWNRNELFKSIVQPRYATQCVQVHSFVYRQGKPTNEHGLERTGISVDNIQINHYWTRSREEFQKKIERQKDTASPRSMDDFDFVNIRANAVEDRMLCDRFAAIVKANMTHAGMVSGSVRPAFGNIQQQPVNVFKEGYKATPNPYIKEPTAAEEIKRLTQTVRRLEHRLCKQNSNRKKR